MLRRPKETSIYVSTSPIDFRKAINGLTAYIAEEFEMPVTDGSVYVFYNRRRDKVKCLFWDKNGFVLYQKRLERGKFKIIRDDEAVDKITLEQLDWLLAGLEYKLMSEFPMLDFSNYF